MKYSKEVIDLVIATINNNSVKVKFDYDANEIRYLLQGFSYSENEKSYGLSFTELCDYYEKRIEE